MERPCQPCTDTPPERLLAALEGLLRIEAVDLGAALDAACQAVADALAADKVDALLYEPAAETLVARGASPTPMGRRQHAIGMDRLPLANGGREAEVYRTGRAYVTGRADEDAGQLRGITEGLGVRSVLAVPLAVAGERRGVLLACSARPDAFSEADLAFLGAVARWVGAIAHRAELVERLAAEARDQGRRVAAEELIATLAHDLGNHLAPLKARVGLLRRRARREDRAGDLGDVEALDRLLDRLHRLIGDLLDASRLDQGLFVLNPGPVNLGALAREAAAPFATEATPIVVEAEEGVVVLGDPARLRQVLENLLANAAKHSPAGAPISVGVACDPPDDATSAALVVADRGPGVPPDLLPRLFGRFERGEGSTGLGLGLYLASRIAQAHGGTLAVDPKPGVGARFVLTLPLADAASGRPTT